MASRCACQRQLEPPGGTTCSDSGLTDCGQPRIALWGWVGVGEAVPQVKRCRGGRGGGGRGRIFALPPHPALSIPTTTTAADPPGTGQARPRRPLFASRRARMGVPAAAPPGGGCDLGRMGYENGAQNSARRCNRGSRRAAVGHSGGIGGAGAGGAPVGCVGAGRPGIGGGWGGPALTSLTGLARLLRSPGTRCSGGSSIPTTTTAADPSRAGRAGSRGPLAAPRGFRPGGSRHRPARGGAIAWMVASNMAYSCDFARRAGCRWVQRGLRSWWRGRGVC